MNKMLIANFNSEADAYKGLEALKELDFKTDITLYATAVVTKDAEGKVSVKQAEDSGPIGTTVGMFTGALVGLLGGPAGVAVGATAGGFSGATFDLASAGIEVDFLNEVANSMTPGKTAVVAEIDEDWEVPVTTKMTELGGVILRSSRYEFVEDQLAEESKEPIAAKEPSKLETIKAKAEQKMTQVKDESEAKIKKLQSQLTQAKDEQKAKIEAKIAALKAEQQKRSDKLQQIKTSVQGILNS